VGKEREAKTLLRFFWDFGKERCEKLEFVCSDMWKAYIKVIEKKAPNALNILDCFHIVHKLGKAIDKIRAAKVKRLAAEGYAVDNKLDPQLFQERIVVAKGFFLSSNASPQQIFPPFSTRPNIPSFGMIQSPAW